MDIIQVQITRSVKSNDQIFPNLMYGPFLIFSFVNHYLCRVKKISKNNFKIHHNTVAGLQITIPIIMKCEKWKKFPEIPKQNNTILIIFNFRLLLLSCPGGRAARTKKCLTRLDKLYYL